MSDVFSWYMSAALHRASVEALRHEIIKSHDAGTPLPVGLILDLLPLNTAYGSEIAARGNFIWTGDNFANSAPEELWVEFDDPVLSNFSVTIPANWAGTLTLTDDELSISFTEPLTITIPEIANQGVNRSALQNFALLRMTTGASHSRFIDALDAQRITWIIATLDPTVSFSTMAGLETLATGEEEVTDQTRDLNYYRTFSTANNCGGGDPEEANWYVYQRISDGICIVHYGTIMMGGQVAYAYRFGPGTKADADRYETNNCGFNL